MESVSPGRRLFAPGCPGALGFGPALAGEAEAALRRAFRIGANLLWSWLPPLSLAGLEPAIGIPLGLVPQALRRGRLLAREEARDRVFLVDFPCDAVSWSDAVASPARRGPWLGLAGRRSSLPETYLDMPGRMLFHGNCSEAAEILWSLYFLVVLAGIDAYSLSLLPPSGIQGTARNRRRLSADLGTMKAAARDPWLSSRCALARLRSLPVGSAP